MRPSRAELKAALREAKRDRRRNAGRLSHARQKLKRSEQTNPSGSSAHEAALKVARLRRRDSDLENLVCTIEKQILEQWSEDTRVGDPSSRAESPGTIQGQR